MEELSLNNMYPDNVTFDADRVYKHSSEFPQKALEEIPVELIKSIDNGNEDFFKGFRYTLPKFCKYLIDNTSQVYLLEMSYFGMGMSDRGKKYKYYCWGCQCFGKFITAEIPRILADRIKLRRHQEYLSCIPPELHCFYQKTDGMAIGDDIGFYGFDLPVSFGHWTRVREYCRDYRIEHNISMLAIDNLYEEFGNGDLRILIRGSLGDIIFLNLSAKDGKLYHVKNNDFLDYRFIENATQTLDTYFANALLGFPEIVSLR